MKGIQHLFNIKATSSIIALAVFATPLAAVASEGTWSGRLVRVSVDNVKVRNAGGLAMSFLIGNNAHVGIFSAYATPMRSSTALSLMKMKEQVGMHDRY